MSNISNISCLTFLSLFQIKKLRVSKKNKVRYSMKISISTMPVGDNIEKLKNYVKQIESFADFAHLDICDGEYKICGYGCLQTMFNDDRTKGSEELER